jgi:AcrR family transcriptional regulator
MAGNGDSKGETASMQVLPKEAMPIWLCAVMETRDTSIVSKGHDVPILKHHAGRRVRRGRAESSARRRIVAGARSHFFAHGFRGVTMDDLAGELGMSKKTLYVNFPSKTALLEAVLTDKFHRVDADLGRLTSGGLTDIISTMRNLLACLQRHLQEIQPPFVRDIHRTAPEIFKSIQVRRRTMVERHFGRLLSEGRKKGIIRRDIPAGLMTEILLGTIDAIVNPARIVELGLTPDAALSTILTIFFHGVITERGRSKL